MLLRSFMIRNVATVLRGTVFGQALGFLVLPLLSRLYDPEAFGHFQLYQSATLVLVVFVSLRFEVALLRAQDGRELQATLMLCMISTFATAALSTAAWATVTAIYPVLYQLMPVPVWVVGPIVILIGVFQFLGYVVTREHLYRESANSKITQAVTYSTFAVAFGVAVSSVGLILADALSRLCASIQLLRSLRGRNLNDFYNISFSYLKSTAYKFREFPLITVFGGVINSLGIVATPIMIYSKFNAEVSGQFALVERAISFPIAMIVGAVSQVYMANMAKAVRENPEQVKLLFHSLLKNLAVIAIAPSILAFLIAPYAFTVIFGSEWQLAGVLAQIMIPTYFIIFVYGGVNMTMMLLGRQVMQTAWEIFRLVCMLGFWLLLFQPDMSVTFVVTVHAMILGGVSLLFLVLAEYSVRKGPTEAALDRA